VGGLTSALRVRSSLKKNNHFRWIQKRQHPLRGHVLELGSGSGYTGICLAKLGLVEGRLTLTDHHRLVLEALAGNVEQNLTSEMGWSCSPRPGSHLVDKLYEGPTTSVAVEHLDWQHFGPADAAELAADVVIGADIVFDEEVLPWLANTLQGSIF
jgi:predicted nicotinamide N-methyase